MSSISKSAFRTFLDMRFRASSSLYFAEFPRPQRSGPLTLTEDARTARAPRSSSPRPQWAVERRLALLTSLLLTLLLRALQASRALRGTLPVPPWHRPLLRWERKTYGQGTGLFCGVSPSPRSPRGSFRSASLHHCRCCCAQETQPRFYSFFLH